MSTHDDRTQETVAQLADRVADLEDEVEQLRRDTISKTTMNHILDALGGGEVEVDDYRSDPMRLRGELEGVADRRAEAIDAADRALDAVADGDGQARADGSGPGQKAAATTIARDAAIKRTAEGIGAGASGPSGARKDVLGSVTITEVREMGEPQHDLAWTSVDRAMTDLDRRWRSLEYDEDASPKRLKVASADTLKYEPGLVEAVERSLARDDLANTLLADQTEATPTT